jgi:hypothetical protein
VYDFNLGPALVAIAVAGAAAGGAAIYGGSVFYNDYKMKEEFTQRAQRALEDKSLTQIRLEEFTSANRACDKERPYGAAFVAKAPDGSFVQGTACMSRTRDTKIVSAAKP